MISRSPVARCLREWFFGAVAVGDNFLAQLCRQWEDAAQQAETRSLRVMRLRTGVVLGRAGGALAQMLPPLALGLGGPSEPESNTGRGFISRIS